MSSERCIVIVGAGFSGTIVAANLLRSRGGAPTRVVLIERAAHVGRGKAYATREHPYLLNVPAGRMSAYSARPLDFLRFAQQRLPSATADDFLPRSLYGDYLETLLLESEMLSTPQVRLERVRGEVSSVEPTNGGRGYRVGLADGLSISADDVVLATGHPAPGKLPGTQHLPESRYVADPWSGSLSFVPGERVLLVGMGLTMADMTLAAAAATHRNIEIHAISRHGLLPPAQTAFGDAVCEGDADTLLSAASFSTLTLVRAVRELAEEAQRNGDDWRAAITFVRRIAPALWKRLAPAQRRRFLRHVRPYWETHRHRLPNTTTATLSQLRAERRLFLHAGRITALEYSPIDDRIRASWRTRGSTQIGSMDFDRVINCTGPDYDLRRSAPPLFRSLLEQGLLGLDPLNLGLATGENDAVAGAERSPTHLYYVGPLLRAEHWEATAVQELRVHAERLATHLSAPVCVRPAAATAAAATRVLARVDLIEDATVAEVLRLHARPAAELGDRH